MLNDLEKDLAKKSYGLLAAMIKVRKRLRISAIEAAKLVKTYLATATN